MKKSVIRWISLVLSAAMMMPLFVSSAAAQTENIIELTDSISVEGSRASQKGSIAYQNWTGEAAASFSGSKVNDNGTFKQLMLVEKKAIDWQNPFTINASQFSASQKTVINVKFKVMLDSYTAAAKPRVGIRLYQGGFMHREALAQSGGKNAFVPTEDIGKNWSIVSFVIDPETKQVYSSFNGSDYAGSALSADVPAVYSGDFRMYFTAITSTNDFNDGSTVLETPVTWYIDDFIAYNTDEMPAPPARPEKEPEQNLNIDYLVKLDDDMSHNVYNFSTSQEGTLYFTRGENGTEISGYEKIGSNWGQINVKSTLMNDWKSTFYLKGEDIKTNRKTIIDMKVKVNAVNYEVSELPQTKLRFYHNRNLFFNEVNVPLAKADDDTWHTVRFVINNEDKAVYSSLDGAAYKKTDYTVPEFETLGNNDGKLNIYPVAVPASGEKVDNVTALSTAVDWYIDTFKAYQFDGDMPAPGIDLTEGNNQVETLLRLTDYMQYNASNFSTSQAGYDLSMGFVKIQDTIIGGEEPNGGFYKQLKLTQNVMSEWKNNFYFDGSKISAKKKTVIDMQFKVNLENYNAENKPVTGIRLSSPDGLLYLDAMKDVTPDEADKDKWQMLRIVLNNENGTAYASINGNPYTSHTFSKPVEGDNYNTQIRIYPIAKPADGDKADGSTKLSTPVIWYINSVVVYQTTGAMPSASDLSDPTAPQEPELPDAYPEPAAAAIPAELAGRVVRAYPGGRMKAVIMSFDDGTNYYSKADKRAIGILNDYGVKGTFNLIPGSTWGTFLQDAAQMYAGHEIASHGYMHREESEITDNNVFMEEIQKSKEMLEAALSYEVPGYATPYGIRFDSKHTRMAQDLGYRYIRTALLTGKFNVPDNFYMWDPTSWLSNQKYWDLIQSQMKNYKEMDSSGEWTVMFTGNHAWEFDANEEVGRTDSWFALTEFVKYVAENSDTMWNPTSIEFVDYVRACRQMKATLSDGAVVLENPTDIDVWANVDGKSVKVGANSTVSAAGLPEREFIPGEYLLNVDEGITQSGSDVSADGTLRYTGAVAAAADGNSFYIKQDTKSAWSRYITVQSPAIANIKLDAPLVIEAKYSVAVDGEYNGAMPNVQLVFQAQDLNIWANSNVGTALAAPTGSDVWNTIKLIVDPNTKKVYCNVNGGSYTDFAADRLASLTQLGNGIRMYLRSYPSGSPDDSQDATMSLDTEVTWTFDYVRMYKLSEKDTVRIAAAKAEANADNVSCTVDIRNYGASEERRMLAAALYDGNTVVDVQMINAALSAFAKDGLTASFSAAGVKNPRVKAFLWDGADTMKPYEAELINVD